MISLTKDIWKYYIDDYTFSFMADTICFQPSRHALALSIISTLGCGISILFLIVTVTLYVTLWRWDIDSLLIYIWKKTHFKMVLIVWVKVRIMVINATFNNISLILWRSVLLMIEGTGIPGENHRSAASHWQTLSLASNAPRLNGIRPLNFRLWLCARNVY